MFVGVLVGYWLLPISGQVLIMPGKGFAALGWPQVRVEFPAATSQQQALVQVTDVVPWAYVVLTVNGWPYRPQKWWRNPGATWTWQSAVDLPRDAQARGTTLRFYHDCHTGCVERGRFVLGAPLHTPTPPGSLPTKLGIVFANPERDWHGRAGWDVELAYARLADEGYWGIDELGARVYQAMARGLRVLVRVDYDRGQALPPHGDYQALSEYLQYVQRLARDGRLSGVYGYIIGSGYNALESNATAPEQPVTPGWYARVFNGYGEAASRTDNVVQTVRAENPQARVLVGPVRPWIDDQDGPETYRLDVPWLNYMNSLVAALDASVRTKAAAGIALAAPDGFAVQAPGRPDAPELAGWGGAEEPRVDLPRADWGGAQAGFRVYRDWLAIINAYPSTRGLPVYITASNTFAPDEGVPPAQNYPRGWLTAALEAINQEPQVWALCWFMDGPLSDEQWGAFSLSRGVGRMAEAAQEFDALLRGEGN